MAIKEKVIEINHKQVVEGHVVAVAAEDEELAVEYDGGVAVSWLRVDLVYFQAASIFLSIRNLALLLLRTKNFSWRHG